MGETAEYKNVQVKLIGYEESYGNDWGKPGDGKVFVFPEFEITNNSNEEISVSSLVSFECYVDDYKTDFSSNAFMAISTVPCFFAIKILSFFVLFHLIIH